MYIRNGKLLDANTDGLAGTDAAFEIFSWKNAAIILAKACTVTEPKISDSLGFILLESSRRQDERNTRSTSIATPRYAADSYPSSAGWLQPADAFTTTVLFRRYRLSSRSGKKMITACSPS